MVDLYDEAVVEKIRSFIPKNSSITVASPNSTEEVIIKIKEGSISFPVIFIRPGNFSFKGGRSFSDGLFGEFVKKTEDGRLLYLQADAIKLVYQIGVLATSKADSVNLIREILFKLRKQPRITIMVPFGLDKQFNFSVHQLGDIEFNHSSDSFMESGILHTSLVPIEINGARLFQVNSQLPQHINPVLGAD